MTQENELVPCSKCGVPVRSKGRGPHEVKCTGDPERTKALEGRRERTRRIAQSPKQVGPNPGGRRVFAGVDLASMTWEQLLVLVRGIRAEIKDRYQEAKRLSREEPSGRRASRATCAQSRR